MKSQTDESTLVAVYDILNCGPRSRFVANGKIVHNSGWGYNPQNLPRIYRDKQGDIIPSRTNVLRLCMKAPKGYRVVVSDLSGIEMRVNHFLWKVASSMKLFTDDPENADLYRHFAASLYNVAEEEVVKQQRQIGKVCLAEGTLVLCKHERKAFWLPIEQFRPEFQLWDGVEWVWAKGLAYNGLKITQRLCGVSLTPEHLVLSGETWMQAQFLSAAAIRRALATAAENLSLQAMLLALKAGSPMLSLRAIVGFLSTQLQRLVLKGVRRADAIYARSNLAQTLESCIGGTLRLCRTTHTAKGYLTGYPQLFHAATPQQTSSSTTTEGGEYRCSTNGAKIEEPFSSTSSRCPGGISRYSKWIVSTLMGTTLRAISVLCRGAITRLTNAKSLNWSVESLPSKQNSRVFDILDCGPRNQFTVLSNRGPLIVHNCHLGLGFSAGWSTFIRIAKNMGGVDMEEDESRSIVQKWRLDYIDIVRGWKTSENALEYAHNGQKVFIDPWEMCHTVQDGIMLPSGRKIDYPNLRRGEHNGRAVWKFGEGRHLSFLSGGKVDENLVQAIARDIIAENSAEITRQTGIYPALLVHDERVDIVRENQADEHLATMNAIMRTPPKWWPELMVYSQGSHGESYGESK